MNKAQSASPEKEKKAYRPSVLNLKAKKAEIARNIMMGVRPSMANMSPDQLGGLSRSLKAKQEAEGGADGKRLSIKRESVKYSSKGGDVEEL